MAMVEQKTEPFNDEKSIEKVSNDDDTKFKF